MVGKGESVVAAGECIVAARWYRRGDGVGDGWRVLGTVVGKRAEMVGGVVLMLVGATILYEHLSA